MSSFDDTTTIEREFVKEWKSLLHNVPSSSHHRTQILNGLSLKWVSRKMLAPPLVTTWTVSGLDGETWADEFWFFGEKLPNLDIIELPVPYRDWSRGLLKYCCSKVSWMQLDSCHPTALQTLLSILRRMQATVATPYLPSWRVWTWRRTWTNVEHCKYASKFLSEYRLMISLACKNGKYWCNWSRDLWLWSCRGRRYQILKLDVSMGEQNRWAEIPENMMTKDTANRVVQAG
jgi:hypothetical protein